MHEQEEPPEKGISREDLEQKELEDAITGQPFMTTETREHYQAQSFENIIMLPDRVKIMCKNLFEMFLQTGGPHQKSVIFCVRDIHADAVPSEMNNRYADWCSINKQNSFENYENIASKGFREYGNRKRIVL